MEGSRAQGPITILVVEDEAVIRLDLVDTLETAGFRVLEAANADDAIAVLSSRNDVELVFTDVNMPGSMDGLRLAAYVRKRWPPIKLIVTSGKVVPGAPAMPEGVPFLSKPYDARRVVSVMQGMTRQ